MRERAHAARALVLDARAGELEREFPFGVVRQLFEPFAGRADLFDARPASARAGVHRRRPARRRGRRSFAALHGLFLLTLNLAAEPRW